MNQIFKSKLITLLKKLNNGEKIIQDNIDNEYKKVINLLYTVEHFPVDNSNENIYCFTKSKRKHFNKYQIQDIVDLLIDYQETINTSFNPQNPADIIIQYVENHNNDSKHIESIIEKYVQDKNDEDSKNIKQLIFNYIFKKDALPKKEFHSILLEYAIKKEHQSSIAKTIKSIYTHKKFCNDIQAIVKEPKRDDKIYQIISSYAPYELTHCISYEMAIRNKDVKSLLKSIQNLTILSKKLFKYYTIYNDTEIEKNPYFDLQNIVEEALSLLNQHNIAHDINIKFRNFKLFETHSSVMQIVTQLIMILEEDYYMIYDRKEIVPEGMEGIFKEPNHYEPDRELNQYMDKAIDASIKNAYDISPRYKDNFTFKDGYAVYQASYEDSKEYDINKIFPNFKRPMREFNQTQVAFNMSLPKNEILAYIEKIKDDYDNKNTSYKTLNQLLYDNDIREEDTLEHKQNERYADDFFIYDYYTQSDQEHKKKIELIQKRLSQYHGMKIEKGRNDYEIVNYDEANDKKNNKPHSSPQTSPSTLDELKMSFKNNQHIIHYLAIDIIETRYTKIQDSIYEKKYKRLICH